MEPSELLIPRREFYRKFFIGNAAFGNERTLRQEGFCKETAGSPEAGLPVLNLNTTDCRYSNLSATAEMISTSSAKGTPSFTLKVKPSLFSCANISTEISEVCLRFIAFSPRIDLGSTVISSWAVAVFSSTAPAAPAAAFHFGSFFPQIPARILYEYRQRLNARFSRQSLFFGKRENTLTSLVRVRHFTRVYAAEKMPEQNNRPGIVRRYCKIKSTSAAAQITVRETEPSKLTEKSALKDNSSNTVRSSSSRIILASTTCLLAYQGPDAYPRRFRPCVFLPFEKLGARLIGASAPSFRSIPNRKTVQDSTRLRQKGNQLKYQSSAALIASVHYRFLLSQAGRTVPELTFGG